MSEASKVERDLMSEEEFKEHIESNRGLKVFDGIRKYKSVFRAIRRGHVTDIGVLAPDRPFNNRKNTSKRNGVNSRVTNQKKREIYGEYKSYQRKVVAK